MKGAPLWQPQSTSSAPPAPASALKPGQGTVEYVGLILLVSLLMVGMVAAMKGFSGESGLDIAEVIVAKIKSAVQAITFGD